MNQKIVGQCVLLTWSIVQVDKGLLLENKIARTYVIPICLISEPLCAKVQYDSCCGLMRSDAK